MECLNRLRDHLVQVPSRLTAMPAAELTRKAPGTWSRKEILGHLIDSAVNNLKRFTDAQFAETPYPIQRYSQDQLVIVNTYQNLPLDHLLSLWQTLNTQIIYVAEAMPADTLARPIQLTSCDSANLTLQWLIEDYVAHLEHHLNTLL
ncbi:DinB family protein [Spirosoma sp. KNUC1025]|uniref:DinB family protein n=1 Tax=Spirosoma sp. KNUC1025 TaxID=2894082 RepID=UPI0038691580|nr:DinB family protein [Spirosoma sp. KNUC1025]